MLSFGGTATAVEGEPGGVGEIGIQLEFPGGIAGTVRCSMMATTPEIHATVTGTNGVMAIANPFIPSQGSTITVRSGDTERTEKPTTEASYNFQLRAVLDTLLRGAPTLTGMPDAIANMDVIDAAYRAAGIPAGKLGIGVGFYGTCWAGGVDGPNQDIGES